MQQKATIFEFTSYRFDPAQKRVVFKYTTKFQKGVELSFTETITLPKTPPQSIDRKLLKKLLEGVHLVLGISYYKCYCAQKVSLPYELSKQEADFWNIVYRKGLGEFFYRNKINPANSPKFPYTKGRKHSSFQLPTSNFRGLVGLGGGKDSIIVVELLKQRNFDFATFSVETDIKPKLIHEVSRLIGKKHLVIQRKLDEKVYDNHMYNGHIPVSAIYAFLGLFSSVLYGYKHFIVGNEYSSNFGNLKYRGDSINHQWSKSFEFEKLLQDYINHHISEDIFYFSLLRPFYEIRIAKLFARLGKKYFKHFSSCNRNFSTTNELVGGLWCKECPKCVFTFTLLSAFLPKKKLLAIFRKNLYRDKNVLPLFADTLGFGAIKPFDCIGTFQEAQTALYLGKEEFKKDFIVKELGRKVKYHPEVFKTQKEFSAPESFRFLGQDNALILGYGKEGRATQQYLKKYYPGLKVSVADQNQGKDYLKKQHSFDVAIKTPGIKKELLTIPYTTATNMFLSQVIDKHLVIGVTGSKGKSTTASLIYQILKTAGKRVELLGNIGKPMLERLLRPIKKDTIFVLELSSYQLNDIQFSPRIAVVTNLFEEHMDFHGNVKKYFEAKKNIINHQKKSNYFVYNQKNKIMAQWLKGYQGIAVPCIKKHFKTHLLGEHNQDNIGAAAAVANILGIRQKTVQKALEQFQGLPHRLEFVGKFGGIIFYDDAISTTPESTIMALKALGRVDTIFLGGEDRGYHFSELDKELKKHGVRNVVLFPDSGNRINVKGLNALKTKSMKEAVEFAFKYTKKGSICLLSCASPSYSLWKNFEEKGDKFQKEVRDNKSY